MLHILPAQLAPACQMRPNVNLISNCSALFTHVQCTIPPHTYTHAAFCSVCLFTLLLRIPPALLQLGLVRRVVNLCNI